MDIQNLSNHHYSSKLEYLGLAAAAASYCKEQSDENKVEIQFLSEGMREHLPQDVSLCLFRVLQGALENALSQGGSQRVKVLLRVGSNEVYLTVRDSGIGFDVDDAATAAPDRSRDHEGTAEAGRWGIFRPISTRARDNN